MIKTYAPFGYEGQIVDIEVDLRKGIPATDIVGLADSSVKEARERVQAAIRNQGYSYPPERVLLSLSPADIRKEGAGFDLPIALAILQAQNKINVPECVLVMGELTLSGQVLPVKGVQAALQDAQAMGIKYAIIPEGNSAEHIPENIKVARVKDLTQAFEALKSPGEYFSYEVELPLRPASFFAPPEEGFDDIKDHNGLKFAMAVAAAGRHSLLVVGSPGCGKTTCLQHFPDLMPLLTPEEKASVDRIRSLAGLPLCSMGNSQGWKRPFRQPHQTASIEGICGGGVTCRPGEISLAHNGVLFLDEAAEFRASVLQMLRVPMENHTISLSRAGRVTTYPAHFQLIMATNPCPCGNYGSKDKICLCSSKSVENYWKKFSAPLLDRVAIRFYDSKESNEGWVPDTLEEYRVMIERAWKKREERGTDGKVMDKVAGDIFDKTAEKHDWTEREKGLVLSVAVTISDMLDYEEVNSQSVHLAAKLHEFTDINIK